MVAIIFLKLKLSYLTFFLNKIWYKLVKKTAQKTINYLQPKAKYNCSKVNHSELKQLCSTTSVELAHNLVYACYWKTLTFFIILRYVSTIGGNPRSKKDHRERYIC